MALPEQVSFPSPAYVVAAPLAESGLQEQAPIVYDAIEMGTFDDELLPALPGIWYAMHLPK